MLVNLSITDLAVVKTLNLDVEQGMSVLTGETGAGKSILLTALGLALGDRADSGYVRPECRRAEINLEFDLTRLPQVRQWLVSTDLDNDDTCLIRRVITEDGRSKAYINNRQVTLQTLQDLSEQLVQIHGQHAHLTLLNPDEQRRLLDSFAKTQPLADQVNACYRKWHKTQQELDSLIKAAADREQREEFLIYQIDELKQLDLSQFDYAALSEAHSKLANMEHILAISQKQVDCLYENDNVSVCQLLNQSVNEINDITQFAPELNAIAALLNEAQIQAEEAALELRRFLKNQEVDPGQLVTLETQLALIQKLSRKHHVAPEELPQLAINLELELTGLSHSGERIEELREQLGLLANDYQRFAAELSSKRHEQATKLQQQISMMIQELGMPQGEFKIGCTTLAIAEPQPNGNDKIEFLVSANPGLPPKPLAKVASGGELSRISLAIQVATASDHTMPTMIFDEVDSGIGGGTAEIVGKKLRNLSIGRQVLCVTHLPQVAAQAHHHLYVQKNNQSDMTSSTVKTLSDNERVEEIARMLGGITITENTLAHAREMLTTGNFKP
jgi:DNA repair protein RecN (Recombination protein N)